MTVDNYTPGIFQVHRHVRGKWVCRRCEKLIQAPVPPHVIDEGIPTAALLAYILVAKFADHQPLYRLEGIFERSGVALARSSLAQWVGACGVRLEPLALALKAALLARDVLHADETPADVEARSGSHTPRVSVELRQHAVQSDGGCRLRLCRWAQR